LGFDVVINPDHALSGQRVRRPGSEFLRSESSSKLLAPSSLRGTHHEMLERESCGRMGGAAHHKDAM
jgi:hypothetical protein